VQALAPTSFSSGLETCVLTSEASDGPFRGRFGAVTIAAWVYAVLHALHRSLADTR
jgi:hypothetical protein